MKRIIEMKLLYSITLVAVGLTVAGASRAEAQPYNPGCPGCGAGGGGRPGSAGPSTLTNGARLQSFFDTFHRTKLPVFQAAPWYNYWPYDAHFLTPAPVNGQFYGPPMTGNFPTNPYFPGPSNVGGYGAMPGGPPPGWPSAMPGR
jgi:hypothetical protein